MINGFCSNKFYLLKRVFLLQYLFFFNTSTATYDYSRSNGEFTTIQMQLSEKPKIFCCFFTAFLESALNFEHFEKQMSLLA